MAAVEDISWNVDLEVSLFHAMRKHKPIGVNRHFQMMCIHDRMNAASQKRISVSQIWEHLSNMYDLQALHESEIIPFPNKEVEFQLPKNEYSLDGEFPRSSHQPPDEESSEPSKECKESPSASKTPKPSDKAHERVVETSKQSDDSPKRKRTRQATQSPASETSGKRSRRN